MMNAEGLGMTAKEWEEFRAKLVRLRQEGMSERLIARSLGVSAYTVRLWLQGKGHG
jgi:transposase